MQLKLYNTNSLLSYHALLADEMRKQYEFPETFQFKWLANRKNIQIVFLSTTVKKWEQLSMKQYKQTHIFQQYKQTLLDIISEYMKPKLEAHYQTKISYYYLFNPHLTDNTIYTFSVKVFETSLFKNVDAHQIHNEEKIANMMSRHIRELNGRGPERVTVAILDNCYVVFFVSGLISCFNKEYAYSNQDAFYIIQKMMTKLVEDTIDWVCQTEYQVVPEKFTEVDFEHNHIISLVIIKPRVKGNLV